VSPTLKTWKCEVYKLSARGLTQTDIYTAQVSLEGGKDVTIYNSVFRKCVHEPDISIKDITINYPSHVYHDYRRKLEI
jgi:hypothetical protein